MAHKSSNYYGSKSLNAQWKDLSRSVSYLLNEHEEPMPKAESLGHIGFTVLNVLTVLMEAVGRNLS